MDNRQMSREFKKLGFHKAPYPLTRVGVSYTYKDSKALFTYPKAHKATFQVSAPRQKGWSVYLMSPSRWEELQQLPIDWHWDKSEPFTGELTPMEALLCMARSFAEMWEERSND